MRHLWCGAGPRQNRAKGVAWDISEVLMYVSFSGFFPPPPHFRTSRQAFCKSSPQGFSLHWKLQVCVSEGGGSGHVTLPAPGTASVGGLHTGAGGNGRHWGSQGSWTVPLKPKVPLQGPHSLSDATIRMERRVWPFRHGPEDLPDLWEATGGSFSSEWLEMSPQLHQLGVQNCL